MGRFQINFCVKTMRSTIKGKQTANFSEILLIYLKNPIKTKKNAGKIHLIGQDEHYLGIYTADSGESGEKS